MKKVLLLFTMTILTSTAIADQCAYITLSEAQKAIKTLLDAKSVKSLCEPCGEKKAKPVVIKTLTLQKTGLDKLWEVRINNKGIDLAYIFADSKNLAIKSGCVAEGVSDEL